MGTDVSSSQEAGSGPGTLTAACSNCASWRIADPRDVGDHERPLPAGGVCTRGFAPEPGAPRCEEYTMSGSFQELLVRRLMPETTAIPIPLPGKAARDARKGRAR